MRKLFISILVVGLVLGMSFGVMADDNEADVEQQGNGLEAYVEQIGNLNDTKITQTSTNGMDMLADVFQEGNNNESIIDQVSNNKYLQEAFIDQRGDYNFAKINQPGRNAEGYINQDGYDNTAEIHQNYKKNKHDTEKKLDGYINQVGNDNSAYINHSMKSFGYSYAGIMQDGNDNNASIEQHQDNGDFYGSDSSSGEWAVISQIGDQNDADINQNGLYNEAIINQNGNNNISEVIQASN